MSEKLFRIIKNICSPTFYKEVFRKQLYYLYEHCIPLKEMTKGDDLEIHPTASFRYGKNITLMEGLVVDANCSIWASENSKIVISENVSIGQNTVIISSNHSFYKKIPYKKQPESEKDIFIGKDVWIGANCIILPGVTVGKGVIIGAGAIISQDIPEFTIAVSKCRELRFIKR
ncbi:MAG TPA: acyltransferase [Nitrospinota bacterium]|jgi:acetyltransferase-like isoleucine patch superfamily enzyme|nr:acyltransferase [Nitrospinota bacterium]|tara:strand:- start:7352 stop:7870 length:519 start_codon:yes stop_codon:yes gene_type:complete